MKDILKNMDIMPAFTAFGSTIFYGLILLLFAFYDETMALKLFLGYVISISVAVLIRIIYWRERP